MYAAAFLQHVVDGDTTPVDDGSTRRQVRSRGSGAILVAHVLHSRGFMTGPVAVAVNGRFLTQEVTGVQRYAREVVRSIDELLNDGDTRRRFDIELVVPPDAEVPPLRHIQVRRVGRIGGHAWEQLVLPVHARRRLLVSLCNTGPVVKVRQVVTMHDASVYDAPDGYSRRFRYAYRVLLPVLGRSAREVVTVSDFSRQRLHRRCRIPLDRLRVIHHGIDHLASTVTDASVLEAHGLRRDGFLLMIGANRRKNIDGVLAAVEAGAFGLPLVLVGPPNTRVFGDWHVPGGVIAVGRVADPALRALYENAACLLFPSFYEGFGMPALEAMVFGCPVVAARAGALPEVCGQAAEYCDPHQVADIVRAIGRIVHDTSRRTELRRRGREWADTFRWSRAARQLLEVVEQQRC